MKIRYTSNAVTLSLAFVLSIVLAPFTVYGQQTPASA
jgi:hypothetical protein